MISDDKFEELIETLRNNRNELNGILSRIEHYRNKLDTLIPEKLDFRNKKFSEQTMKVFTEVIKAELDVRKQIDSSINSEFDLYKKKDKDEEIGKIDSTLLSEIIESLGNRIPEEKEKRDFEMVKVEDYNFEGDYQGTE